MSEPTLRSRAGIRGRQIAALTVAGMLAVVMLGLGVWQMSVYVTQGRNSLIERSNRAPVALNQQLDSGLPIGDLYGLPVRLDGHYLAQPPVLVGSSPPYRVVSAFVDHSRIVPVVRGSVPSLDTAVPPAPGGSVSLVGIMMPSESTSTGSAPPGAPSGWLNGVRIERLAQGWPTGVTAGFVTLDAASARVEGLEPAIVTFPNDASGNAQNLGYAIQWWVFAIFAMVMGIALARSFGRRSDDADLSDAGTRPEAVSGEDAAAG
ncbi:MAG: SURF1 family protein [Propionibacterium sp.]|nr:SURF1 family protein [Propionibacterium sp.]